MEDQSLTPEEEQRAENEIKALKLDLQFDGETFISDDAPPEIISQFLDHVQNFESAHQDEGKRISILEFIGSPKLPAVEELPDDEYQSHIDSLLSLLEEKGIILDPPKHLRPRGFYRFLLEDLLPHQIPEYHHSRMILAFAYDDFRHDSPEFIRDHVETFLLELLNLDQAFEGTWLSETCRGEFEAMTKAEVLENIAAFRAQYSRIVPIAFKPQEVKRTEAGLYFFFLISWEGIPVGGGESEQYEGLGVSQLGWTDEEWWVEGIMMPGFQF